MQVPYHITTVYIMAFASTQLSGDFVGDETNGLDLDLVSVTKIIHGFRYHSAILYLDGSNSRFGWKYEKLH